MSPVSKVSVEEIEAALREGMTDTDAARSLRTGRARVTAVRRAAGIPRPAPRPSPNAAWAATAVEGYWARAGKTVDGHVIWSGHRTRSGTPVVFFAGTRACAYRVAWDELYDREPVGVIRPVCGVEGCVAGRCLEDQVARDRVRAQLGAWSGRDHSGELCRSGRHRMSEHAEFDTSGARRCRACRAERERAWKRARRGQGVAA